MSYQEHLVNPLAVQWLGLCAFTAEGPGSIRVQGTKIPQATQRGQKKRERNTFYMEPRLHVKPTWNVGNVTLVFQLL